MSPSRETIAMSTSPFPNVVRPPITDAERHRAVRRMTEVFELVQGKSLDGRSLRHCEKLLQQAGLALGMSYRGTPDPVADLSAKAVRP